MKNFNLKIFSGVINNQPADLHNARDLHAFLEISTRFDTWIQRRIADYNFVENLDFIERSNLSNRGFFKTEIKEYHITLDMAKELCMLERSELGQKARRYFIKMEKEALQARQHIPTLPPISQNAVQLNKDRYIELLENENQLLRTQPNPLRKKAPVPLTMAEKSQILQLAEQGITKAEIAVRLNRSKSAVRAVIRESLGK